MTRGACNAATRLPIRSTAGLQFAWMEAENGAVQSKARFTALAAAVLCACLTGVPATATGLQPASYKIHEIPPEERIDINHATLDELLKVPGMTRSWAGRIVRYRPYYTKRDLLEHGVVSSQVYDRIKDYVIAHRNKQ